MGLGMVNIGLLPPGNQPTQQRAESQVINLAEVMQLHTTCTVQHDARRRTAQSIACHGSRRPAATVGLIYTDGEGPTVLVYKGLQRLYGHRVVVLEDCMQTDNGEIIM